jgi:hypothetical protein
LDTMKEINFIKSEAVFSEDKKYRYQLTRVWNESKPMVGFIALNPSIADETENDPTIWKLVRSADGWGYGGLIIVNLFALVSSSPEVMKTAKEPIGKNNDQYLEKMSKSSDLDKVIAVWGDDGVHLNRASEVKKMFSKLWVLKLSETGQPRHPRFLKADVEPFLWI